MIEKFASKRNIQIINSLYRGISDEYKQEIFCQLYEIYHTHSSNFRFRMPQQHLKFHLAIKDRGFTLKELNEIEAYDGTESTCRMMRQMIDVVTFYWEDER